MHRAIVYSIIVVAVLSMGNTLQAKTEGGPDSVGALLANEASAIEQWNQGKGKLKEKTGFSFGLDYTTLFLGGTDVPGGADDFSVGGIARAYGRWEFVNRGAPNNGSLNWKIESRDSYTDIAPQRFNLNIGNVGAAGPTFTDEGVRLTNLYWRQSFADDNIIGYIGYLYTSGFVDAYELASPWSGFSNLNFGPGASTIAFPSDSAFGLMLGTWITDEFYVMGSLSDRNSDPTDPFRSAVNFFEDAEYFKSIEFGWSSSNVPYYKNNVHLTAWHIDESEATGAPSGWGLNFSAAVWMNDDTILPFLRMGYAEDAGSPSLLETSINAGVAFHVMDDKDLLGIGVNWGKPNEVVFGKGRRDQVGAEMFYRKPIGGALEVTPFVQLLFDPALNPNEDLSAIFGFRAKVAF
jgi:porin